MTPLEFEKKNKSGTRVSLRQNILPASLSLAETPGKTGASSIEELKTDLLDEYHKEMAKRKRNIKLKFGIFTVLIFIFTTISYLLHTSYFISMLGYLFSIISAALMISQRQKQVMMSLSYIEDKSLIGVLCEMSEMKDIEIQCAARTSLMKILPKLNANDSELLDKFQRQLLINQLSLKQFAISPAYIKFQCAVLKAYEQIGGAEEKAIVQELANSQTYAPSVRVAANSCLPYLDIRIAEERERHQLLRASSFTTLGTDELLRPVKGSADSEPETLLRPVQEEE